ncbi:MAG TPA: glycosyltransferase family 39 protein, partial [Candidatus Acidoferrales bacterium]|nr:glycosyltransferase family 39 protein [Candidatus Acidoferrales bacterium]
MASQSRWHRVSVALDGATRAIERHPVRVFTALSLFYVIVVVALACIKMFWFDEFITVYIAKLGSPRAVWDALYNGADPNPPLTHLLVALSIKLFGTNQLAARLPAIVAEWFGVAFLFAFLRKRVRALYAACGVLFYMATHAFTYSVEARSYAFTLCFAMASLWAWRRTVEGRRPTRAACFLALMLALGISSNYFAVLAFFPIAAGELTRNLLRRKLEFHVWIAMAAGAVPLFLYMPLVNHAIAIFAPHAWNKPRTDVIELSYTQMMQDIFYPALALLALAAVVALAERFSSTRGWRLAMPAHELVAVATQMAYPVLGYAIAVARAGMISPRFVLPMCYGFAIATALAGHRLFSRWAFTSLLFLVVCLGYAVTRNSITGYDYQQQREALYRVRDSLPATGTIAVSDSLLALPLYYYSPPQIAKRIVFPIDFEAIRRYKKEDSPEQNLWAGRNLYPIPVLPLWQFQQQTPGYTVITTGDNWLLSTLDEEGTPAHQLPIETHSHDLVTFTPLCHDAAHFYEFGDGMATAETHEQSAEKTQP